MKLVPLIGNRAQRGNVYTIRLAAKEAQAWGKGRNGELEEHLSLRDVTVGYGRIAIVEHIHVGIAKGRMTCILGSNGAGKTTLFKTITGILPPLGGEILLNGKKTSAYSRKQLAREIAAVLTARVELPDMTGFDVACMGRIPHTGFFGVLAEHDREIARQSLRDSGAEGLAERLFSEMSDGEKQKVLIARGLCQDTGLLLLDEPTSHLDIRYKLELLESLRRQCVEQGRTVLCTLHEPDLAVKCSDYLILVKGNHILAGGPTDEIVAGGLLDQLYDFTGRQFNASAGLVEFPAASGKDYFLLGSDEKTPGLMRSLCRARKGFGAAILKEESLSFHVCETMGAPSIAIKEQIPDALWKDAWEFGRQYPAVVVSEEIRRGPAKELLDKLKRDGKRVLSEKECRDELGDIKSPLKAQAKSAAAGQPLVLLFGGTSEGRELSDFCGKKGIPAMLSVATEYGKELAGEAGVPIAAGRMDEKEIEAFIREHGFQVVVDATHPFAREVTKNIVSACEKAKVPYIRLKREESETEKGVILCRDAAEAALKCGELPGNILLTTGSKELAAFSSIRGFEKRVYARVLPMEDSIRACRELGLSGTHILAEQGPFSKEWNLAVMREFSIRVLVTKDTGERGGYPQKRDAANEAGASIVLIGRPNEEGLPFKKVCAFLEERFQLSKERKEAGGC